VYFAQFLLVSYSSIRLLAFTKEDKLLLTTENDIGNQGQLKESKITILFL